MSTQDRTSSDGSPSEGRQDATRQDPDPIDIDNDEEDLSEANDTTSISVCSTPPGLNDALGFDDLAVHDKPSQHATSVAEVNTQLTTRQVFVAGFDPPPSLQSRDQEELRQHIGSGAPPNDQLTSILQTARWKVDIAVNIFNLWHELGPPPNRSPNRAQSNGRQQPKSVSPTPSMINEMEAADIEEAKRKSAAEAAANSCDVRANDESASAIETDKEESRNAEEKKATSHAKQYHNLNEPDEAAGGRDHPLDRGGQRLGSGINAASGGPSREEIAGRHQRVLRSTQSQTATQSPRPNQAPPKKTLHKPWKEDIMTPGDIRIRKIGQRDLLTVAPQVNPPQPPATEPSIETHRPEHMQPVSSQAEQIARSTRSPTLVLRGPTQETSPTTLRSSEPPTLTLRGRTQQMTPTAQRAEDRERSIPNSDRDDQPDESRSMQYEKVFPPYGGLLNPAPASASPRKPRPTYTMAQALEYVKTQDSRRAAAEADAAAESSGVQSEQGISDDLQGPVGRSDRTMQLREPGGSVDEISGEVENLTRDIDGNDGGVCEDEKQRSSEGGSLANASSKEDKRNDG